MSSKMPHIMFGSTTIRLERNSSVAFKFNDKNGEEDVHGSGGGANLASFSNPQGRSRAKQETATLKNVPYSPPKHSLQSRKLRSQTRHQPSPVVLQPPSVSSPMSISSSASTALREMSAEEECTARHIKWQRKLEMSLYRSGELMDAGYLTPARRTSQWLDKDYDHDTISASLRGERQNKHLRWFKNPNSSSEHEEESKDDTHTLAIEKRMHQFAYYPSLNIRQNSRDGTSEGTVISARDARNEKCVKNKDYNTLKVEDGDIDALSTLSQPYDLIHRRSPTLVSKDDLERQQRNTLADERSEKGKNGECGCHFDNEQIKALATAQQTVAEERAALAAATAELSTVSAQLFASNKKHCMKRAQMQRSITALEEQVNKLIEENRRLAADSEMNTKAAAEATHDVECTRQVFEANLTKRLAEQQHAEWRRKLVRGGVFLRHRSGSPHKCLVYCDRELRNVYHANMGKLYGRIHHTSIPLSAVLEVRNGIKTKKMKRSAKSEHVYGCLSLVGQDFTLDLELPFYPKDVKDGDRLVEENRNEWLEAFKWATQHLKVEQQEQQAQEEI